MASLVLGAVGAAVGFYFGGPTGAQVGWMAGSTVGSLIDPNKLPTQYGPKMADLKVMASTYGARIPLVYGTMRLSTNVIWSTDLVQHEHSTEVGKGGGQGQTVSYTYSLSCAVAICEGEIEGVTRIWMNSQLVYSTIESDATDVLGESLVQTWRVYNGTTTQDRDPTIEADAGADFTPAYRGVAYIVFDTLDLTAKFGNRIPSIEVEVARIVFNPPAELTPLADTDCNDGTANNTGGTASVGRSSIDYNRHRIYAGATSAANPDVLSYIDVNDNTVQHLELQIALPSHPLLAMYSFILDKLVMVTCVTNDDPVTYYIIDPDTGIATTQTSWPNIGKPLRLFYEDLARQKLRSAGTLGGDNQTWNPADKEGGAEITWNPSANPGGLILSNGNKTVSSATLGTGSRSILATAPCGGKKYYEILASIRQDIITVGVGATATSGTAPVGRVGNDIQSFGYSSVDGSVKRQALAIGGGATFDLHVIGVAVDVTVSPWTFKVYKNNVLQSTVNSNTGVVTPPTPGPIDPPTGPSSTPGTYPMVGIDSSAGLTTTLTGRWLAADLTYTPPAGYSAWGSATTITLSNGNLTVAVHTDAAGPGGVRGTQALGTSAYFELDITSVSGSSPAGAFGVANLTYDMGSVNPGSDANAYVIRFFGNGGANAIVSYNGVNGTMASTIGGGDVIGCRVSNNGTIQFSKNGTVIFTGTLPAGTWYAYTGAETSSGDWQGDTTFAFGGLAIFDTRGMALIANLFPLVFADFVDLIDGYGGNIYVLMNGGGLYQLAPPTTTGAQWTVSLLTTINTGTYGVPQAILYSVTRATLFVTCSDGVDGNTKCLEIDPTDGSIVTTISVPALGGTPTDVAEKAKCLVVDRVERLIYIAQFPYYVSDLSLASSNYNSQWGDTSSTFGPVNYDGTLVTMEPGDHWDIYPSPLFLGQGLNETVSDIVLDIAERVGLDNSQLDVSALVSMNVPGYVLGTQNTARSAIEPLAMAFQFDAVESDGVIKFVPRNQSSIIDIPEEDYVIVDEKSDPIVVERLQDTDLPWTYNVEYLDVVTNYQQAAQYSRRLIGHSDNVRDLQLPMALTSAFAGQIADNLLYEAWAARLHFTFTLSRKYAAYEPTDVVTLHKSIPNTNTTNSLYTAGASFQARIISVSDDGSKMVCEAVGQDSRNGP